MARRVSARSIKTHRSYTYQQVADALGVTVQTVRLWRVAGLPVLHSQKPHLILGYALKECNRPVGTALARSSWIWGDRDDVVIDVNNYVYKICADQAAILLSEFSGSGFQFQGSSS